VGNNFEVSRRYRQVWDTAAEVEHGQVIPTVEEPYVVGSLRPEITSLTAEIGGQLIRVTNGEAAYLADDELVLARLSALEELASV
jgi:hypothetical protein